MSVSALSVPVVPGRTSLSPYRMHRTRSSDLEGHIQVIFGPMFSGKTTELMRRMKRYTWANKRCQVIKYKKDTRYDSSMASTHDLQKMSAWGCDNLSELRDEDLDGLDVIGIDEAQFFEGAVEFADKWASRGKVVIVAALDATFERRPFGRILELIPIAEQVQKLTAVCMACRRDASFTKRIDTSEKAVEVIGGADKYESRCRECFFHSGADDEEEEQETSCGMHIETAVAKTVSDATTMTSPKQDGIAADSPPPCPDSPLSPVSPASATSSSSDAASSPLPAPLLSVPLLSPLLDATVPTPRGTTPASVSTSLAPSRQALANNKRVLTRATGREAMMKPTSTPNTKATGRKRKGASADADADETPMKKATIVVDENNKENAAVVV